MALFGFVEMTRRISTTKFGPLEISVKYPSLDGKTKMYAFYEDTLLDRMLMSGMC